MQKALLVWTTHLPVGCWAEAAAWMGSHSGRICSQGSRSSSAATDRATAWSEEEEEEAQRESSGEEGEEGGGAALTLSKSSACRPLVSGDRCARTRTTASASTVSQNQSCAPPPSPERKGSTSPWLWLMSRHTCGSCRWDTRDSRTCPCKAKQRRRQSLD